MQDYIYHINNFNLKLKKSISETDHHSRIKSIDKISEQFTNFIKHHENQLNNENLAFIKELSLILQELQNYIHFIDHLVKAEPFEGYNPYSSPFSRIKKKATGVLKVDKEKPVKKAYSEGESREEDLLENFDGNLG